MYKIEKRSKRTVNTDPQRRCYNGCHFSSETVWGEWDWLELNLPDKASAEKRIAFWRDLNDYAVSCRGEGSRSEFRAVEYTGGGL